jgi:hypothetical protein
MINEFGFRDEQAEQDRFLNIMGNGEKADQIQQLYRDSYPYPTGLFSKCSKDDAFRDKAERRGFTKDQIDAFLSLQ